jgi:hypothetical protein
MAPARRRPLLGWLVLMTVWGFRRSTAPDAERAWLLAGLALAAGVWFLAATWATGRLRRARRILAELAGQYQRGSRARRRPPR